MPREKKRYFSVRLSASMSQPFGAYTSMTNPAMACDSSTSDFLMAWVQSPSNEEVIVGCVSGTTCSAGETSGYPGDEGSCCGVALSAISGGFLLTENADTGTVQILSANATYGYDPVISFKIANQSLGGEYAGPASVVIGSDLYVGWNVTSSHDLQLATYEIVDGTQNSYPEANYVVNSQTPSGEVSGYNPALANFNGHLYYGYVGAGDGINVDEIF